MQSDDDSKQNMSDDSKDGQSDIKMPDEINGVQMKVNFLEHIVRRLTREKNSSDLSTIFSQHSLECVLLFMFLGKNFNMEDDDSQSVSSAFYKIYNSIDVEEIRLRYATIQEKITNDNNSREEERLSITVKRFNPDTQKLEKGPEEETTALNIANVIWFNTKNIQLLNPNYVEKMSGIGSLNWDVFSENTNSIIEKYISEMTRGLIHFRPNVDPDSDFVAVNTIYFKAMWHTPFEEYNTKESEFFLTSSGGFVPVPMMTLNKCGETYFEDDDMQFLVKFFTNKQAMVFVLNKQSDTIPAILSNDDVIQTIKHSDYKRLKTLQIPKFTSSTTTDIGSVLQNANLNEILNTTYDGISDTPVRISQIIQTCRIEVNEKGTDAGCTTVLYPETSCDGGTKEEQNNQITFIANKPFSYYIVNCVANIVIMSGVFDGIST